MVTKNKFGIRNSEFGILALALALMLTSCQNDDWSFDNYDYTTVYFAYQYPVRTLYLGNDETFDNSLDNEHKCKIYATMGGVYSNEVERRITIAVDESLCDGVYFSDGTAVTPMPSAYYSLASNYITIPAGSVLGGVEVQFTDAFFEDPLSLTNHYVIPLVMTHVENADSILQGEVVEGTTSPHRCRTSDWETVPKDYTLYCVKYVNEFDGMWLRRGKDVINYNGEVSTEYRIEEYVEYDEVFELGTLALHKTYGTVSYEWEGSTLDCKIILSFDADYNCTVTSDTGGCTVIGSGSWVEKGELNSWGATDRDAIYLDYEIDFGTVKYEITDTLVARDRQVAGEWYEVAME